MEVEDKKYRNCRNCKGGITTVDKDNENPEHKGKCLYCNGKGYRTRFYGPDDR